MQVGLKERRAGPKVAAGNKTKVPMATNNKAEGSKNSTFLSNQLFDSV